MVDHDGFVDLVEIECAITDALVCVITHILHDLILLDFELFTDLVIIYFFITFRVL